MKKIFITGGHGDIGRAIVNIFTEHGYQVISPSRLELDLNNLSAVDNYFINNSNSYDAFIHCAGYNSPQTIDTLTVSDLQHSLNINSLSFYTIVKHLAKHLQQQQNGHILALSSIYGFLARTGRLPYTSSKHALVGMMKSLAVELGPANIKVNCLSPGFVDTKMTRKNNNDSTINQFISHIPLAKLASVEDIAQVAYFLASDNNKYINGQDIIVDGGYSICADIT
jgi:3-oxoacyl-[acyl-carrier protein] reductase